MMIDLTNIPNFPEFRPISLKDKGFFDHFTDKFGLFSDFNFNSFYSWNLDGTHSICLLHNNLVLLISDYLDGNPRTIFIGDEQVENTVQTLLTYNRDQLGRLDLKLLPESCIANTKLDPKKYNVEEDIDNFDYVFSLEALATLSGNRYKSKRRAAQACAGHNTVTVADVSDQEGLQKPILDFVHCWMEEKRDEDKDADIEPELTAITNILSYAHKDPQIKINLAMLDDQIVGFSIDELLPKAQVISHYFKTLPSIKGLAEWFNRYIAHELHKAGYSTWNWEQDLGIPGLRQMKENYRPITLQKKYRVTLKN